MAHAVATSLDGTIGIAVIDENGCVSVFGFPDNATGQVPYWNGTSLVWLTCSCGGGGSGGDGCSCLESAAINPAGNLILTKIDQTTIDAGLIVADRPYRTAGAAGAGGLEAQPQSDDGVTVAQAIQHIGNVLQGGVVGDLPEEKHHIKGHEIIENVDPEIEFRRTDAALPEQTSMFAVHLQGPSMDHNLWALKAASDANVPTRFTFQNDSVGNTANTDAMQDGSNNAVQVWHSVDNIRDFAIRGTQPPASPLSPYHTARYSIHIPSA